MVLNSSIVSIKAKGRLREKQVRKTPRSRQQRTPFEGKLVLLGAEGETHSKRGNHRGENRRRQEVISEVEDSQVISEYFVLP